MNPMFEGLERILGEIDLRLAKFRRSEAGDPKSTGPAVDTNDWTSLFTNVSGATECYAREYAGLGEHLIERVAEVIGAFPPDLKKRIAAEKQSPDPELALAYVRVALRRPSPTRVELEAAVASMAVLGLYLSAPAILYMEAQEAFDESRDTLDRLKGGVTAKIEDYKRREGGRKSGATRRKHRDEMLERAARAFLDLGKNGDRVTLSLIAERSGAKVERLRNIGLKQIKRRAETLRRSVRKSAPRLRQESESK